MATLLVFVSSVSDAHEPPFQGIVILPGNGRILNVFGETLTVKVGPVDTAGAYAVVEETSPPGGGTPLHTHAAEDEIIYVLEGQLELQRGQEKLAAGPGTTAVLPRGIPHAFRNVGSRSSKVLVFISPGRFVGFFEELDALSKTKEITPADASRIGAAYELTIHPPPAKR